MIGNQEITTIPPNNLISFSTVGGNSIDHGPSTATFEFIDPTYGNFEDLLIGGITSKDAALKGTVSFRWGYPDQGLESSKWYKLDIYDYMPEISVSGLRITLRGTSYRWGKAISLIEPKAYYGKISRVAKNVAIDMGFSDSDVIIEETDDDYREQATIGSTIEESSYGLCSWFTGNLTLPDFIIMKLIPSARSKSNPEGKYSFNITYDGRFHFHTRSSQLGEVSKTPDLSQIKTFNVLFGKSTNVISFTPEFNSTIIGNQCQEVLAITYDPRLKQVIQQSVDKDTHNPISNIYPKSAKDPSPPLTNDAIEKKKRANKITHYPTKSIAMGGRCSGKQSHINAGPQEALNYSINAYTQLQHLVSGGNLVLAGTPDLVNFDYMEQFCVLNVVKPDGSLHWSSGPYRIVNVTHEIGSSYRITAKLSREVGLAERAIDLQRKRLNALNEVETI